MRAAAERGFSFIELIIVMGVMGMLAALAVGFLTNIGQSTFIDQARAALMETAQACKAASNGGRRATMSIVQRTDEYRNEFVVISAEISRPVLTCQFETMDFASGARKPDPRGAAKISPAGRTGNALELSGGSLLFSAAPDFAMTEGIEVDLWVNIDPRASARRMILMTSSPEAYELSLERVGDSPRYELVLTLKVLAADQSLRVAAAFPKRYESIGAPVRGDGQWQQIQAAWNGLSASLRVDGLESAREAPARAGTSEGVGPEQLKSLLRIAPPEGGLAELHVSSSRAPFYGLIDNLRVRGVFRATDQDRELPTALKMVRPTLPQRIVFYNGRLDPEVHGEDIVLQVTDTANLGDPDMYLQLGRFGAIEPYAPSRTSGTDKRGAR